MLWPDLRAPSLSEVPIPALLARGVRGVILDLDNTLARYRGDRPEPAAARWVSAARESGLSIYLVSNAMPARVAAFARGLGVSGSGFSRKPFRRAFRRALRSLGMEPREVAVIGDQVFTDVLGGNLLGATTVLVSPLDKDEALHTQVIRWVERVVLALRSERDQKRDVSEGTQGGGLSDGGSVDR